MKDKTNAGMTEARQKPVECYGTASDQRYTPITLDDTGLGVPFAESNKTKASVGILTESFNTPMAATQVMVHGICPVKAAAAVKAGMAVYWDITNKRLTGTKAEGTPYIGVALTSAAADGDWVDVLIG